MSALSTVIARGLVSARPAAGNTGRVYFATDGSGTLYRDNGSSWDSIETTSGAVANAGRKFYTGGDKTTTSSSLVAVDTTNAAITLTTGARSVLIGVSVTVKCTSTTDVSLDIDIDGTLQGGTFGLLDAYMNTVGDAHQMAFTYLTAALSAASHTFKLFWKTGAGTATMWASSVIPLHMWAIEQQS